VDIFYLKIISVTSGAEKRACNAEVITLDDSDASFDDEIKIPVKTITARSSSKMILNLFPFTPTTSKLSFRNEYR